MTNSNAARLARPRHRRGVALRLIAATVAVFALAASVRRADAAPPTLSTPQNPVEIALPANSKAIPINWNLNGAAPKAMLIVKDNAQAQVYAQGIAAQTGSAQVTVEFGKTYTAQLTDVMDATKKLGAPLVITTKRPDLGCAIQCIKDVDVDPHGTYANFTVKVDEKVFLIVEASKQAPNASGQFANVEAATFSWSQTDIYNAYLPSLEPNTTYHYVVNVTDQDGKKQFKTGAFKTLKRKVTATFTNIFMTDDSDDVSTCDCTFWFKAGDEAPKQYGEVSVSTGTTVHPNVAFTIINAPDSIKLGAHGLDDDTDFGQFCPFGLGADPTWSSYWTNDGSDSCKDWSANTTTVTISETGLGEEVTKWFTISVNGPALDFTVSGSVTVDYVP